MGLIEATVRPVSFEGPLAWSDEAERGLSRCFYDARERMIEGVKSGKMQLWRVDKTSWLITERVHGRMLFVWCYQGRGLVNLMHWLRIGARQNGCTQVSFFTRHRAALRALRRYSPIALLTPIEGEAQYVIEASDL